MAGGGTPRWLLLALFVLGAAAAVAGGLLAAAPVAAAPDRFTADDGVPTLAGLPYIGSARPTVVVGSVETAPLTIGGRPASNCGAPVEAVRAERRPVDRFGNWDATCMSRLRSQWLLAGTTAAAGFCTCVTAVAALRRRRTRAGDGTDGASSHGDGDGAVPRVLGPALVTSAVGALVVLAIYSALNVGGAVP